MENCYQISHRVRLCEMDVKLLSDWLPRIILEGDHFRKGDKVELGYQNWNRLSIFLSWVLSTNILNNNWTNQLTIHNFQIQTFF